MDMYFRILHDEASGELTYLLADQDTREAVLVDPRGRDLPVLAALLAERELRLRWVLRTHQHDALHVREPAQLARLGAPLVQGAAGENLRLARDGDVLPFGHELIRVLATPGHTAGCLSFAWRDRLFCGGLLAVDACPHQPLPAQPEALWDSVTQRVFTLPDETLLFAGHERRARAVSTVLEQRRWHPFFAGLSRDEFLARVAALPLALHHAAPDAFNALV
ncbi:MBL fold metallo-hydrolase [Polaromonas sp.]|uniref:MBL fold metallo-hydrolase n=1 Tax=Polaromonas sp. TaxID=1869339 RepID=UPI0025DDB8D8|nr:MBL fold metallo-hydrolase [Polaromonas sp.]